MRTTKYRYLCGLLLVTLLLSVYIFLEPYWLENKVYTVKSKDIPRAFENTKIVFISDIHHGPLFSRKRIKRLVERVNRLRPDLILLGGDYVQQYPKYIRPCFEELRHLHAKLGVYGVLGNHDHRASPQLSRKYMKLSGIKYLGNRSYWIVRRGERIKLGGVGDYYADDQYIEPTIWDVSNRDFVILVAHNPDTIEEFHTHKIDLMISGHTHGGQVTVFGLWAPRIPSEYGQRFRTGRIFTNHIELLVSNGVGTEGLPIRFFARPQIVTVILKKIEK